MEGHMSNKSTETSSSSAINRNTSLQYTTDQLSQEACKLDADLQSFDPNLQTRTNQVINTIAAGVEARSLSFDSLKEVIESLFEINQEVATVILECKKDVLKNKELFQLVENYFKNSLNNLDFCNPLQKCLARAAYSKVLILAALEKFEGESEMGGNRYTRTLEALKSFRDFGDPFTAEFFQNFQSVYRQQILMLGELQLQRHKLDKELKFIHSWRKIFSMMFVATFAAVLICSIVAAAMAAPPVAAALAAASSVPVGSMGHWIDSLWKNNEDALQGQNTVIDPMLSGSYVAIQELDNIRVLIDQLEIDIESLLHNASFAIDEGAVKVVIEEIKNKLGVFMKNFENLGLQADTCNNDTRKASDLVLESIIKHSTTENRQSSMVNQFLCGCWKIF